MPGVRSPPTPPGRAQPPDADAPGSEVWAGGLTQDRLVQLRVRQQALEPRVLLFQLLETLGLVHLQPAVLLAPAVVGLIGDPDHLAHRRDRLTLGQFHIRLAELVDDLFRRMTLAAHDLGPP